MTDHKQESATVSREYEVDDLRGITGGADTVVIEDLVALKRASVPRTVDAEAEKMIQLTREIWSVDASDQQ